MILQLSYKVKNKKHTVGYILKTQNLIPYQLDGSIRLRRVNTENVFNNMNKAMFNFSKKLFNPTHKSFYSDIDLQVLNEYHTVIANGMLKSKCKVINPKYINTKTGEISIFMKHSPNRFIDVNVRENKPYFIEVDANKAYTYAFISFNKVPIFNEFGCWKSYSNNDIQELTLYIVKVKRKVYFLIKIFV